MNRNLQILTNWINKLVAIFCLVLLTTPFGLAQCNVSLSVVPQPGSPPLDCTGGDVIIIVSGGGGSYGVFTEDFNGGANPGWNSGGGSQYGQPCGPGINNTDYYWASTSTGTPQLTTNGFDVSCGGDICFDMVYSTQGGSSPCEGPDLPNEGVTLQYSVNGGASWTVIDYWDPNGGYDPQMTTWNTYCFTLPAGANTTNTSFQWIQNNSSGTCCDNWGIDNVQINAVSCGPPYSFNWNQPGVSGDSLYVSIDSTMTFGGWFSNGIDSCYIDTTIQVIPLNPIDAGPDKSLCSGSATGVIIGADPISQDDGVPYSWDNGGGSGVIDLAGGTDNGQITVMPAVTTEYIVTVDFNNCVEVDTVMVVVDQPPTASDPLAINVECAADVPAPDVSVVSDEADDFTAVPIVTFISDVSDGNTCPETITRTYRVTDSCTNYIDVIQTITVHDITAPVFDSPPADVSVECPSDYPAMTNLSWTDNCDGTGSVAGVDVSDGNSCPETIIRTWTYTDACGNVATETQTIIINDITPPTASNIASVQLVVLPAADPSVVTDESDNCTANPVVAWVGDVSDGGFCPEIVTRTYSITDDCGNESFVTQEFIVGDPIPDAQFSADPQVLTNLETEVQFTNNTTGAVSYEWDFDDGSDISNEVNPLHIFPDEEAGGYVVELVAYSPFGCSDTFTLVVQVHEELVFFIPNTFTPDGDEYNQTFKPVFVSGYDPFDYTMFIFNRWGEIVWESHDVTVGWDGTYHGKMVQAGTYQWKIEFLTSETDERKMYTGHISILR